MVEYLRRLPLRRCVRGEWVGLAVCAWAPSTRCETERLYATDPDLPPATGLLVRLRARLRSSISTCGATASGRPTFDLEGTCVRREPWMAE